jgi:DNA-directed RNA polymerase specialized sigma subunit
VTGAQERLVLEHRHLARTVAAGIVRRLPPWVSLDELAAVAELGLCEAALQWRPDGGAAFVSFAWRRMAGAVLDWQRAELRRRGLRVGKRLVEGGGTVPLDRGTPARGRVDEQVEARSLLAGVFALEGRERDAVIRNRLGGVPLAAIGDTWGIGEARVSQIATAALERLAA